MGVGWLKLDRRTCHFTKGFNKITNNRASGKFQEKGTQSLTLSGLGIHPFGTLYKELLKEETKGALGRITHQRKSSGSCVIQTGTRRSTMR
jgi:hypothetical protein